MHNVAESTIVGYRQRGLDGARRRLRRVLERLVQMVQAGDRRRMVQLLLVGREEVTSAVVPDLEEAVPAERDRRPVGEGITVKLPDHHPRLHCLPSSVVKPRGSSFSRTWVNS